MKRFFLLINIIVLVSNPKIDAWTKWTTNDFLQQTFDTISSRSELPQDLLYSSLNYVQAITPSCHPFNL